MSSIWDKIIKEEVSTKHRSDVMNAASEMLKHNAARRPAAKISRRSVLPWGLGMAMASFVAGVFVYRIRPSEEVGGELELWASAPEIVEEDLDLFAELEILEDLEVLEKWEQS
jgi:hypothetical protein